MSNLEAIPVERVWLAGRIKTYQILFGAIVFLIIGVMVTHVGLYLLWVDQEKANERRYQAMLDIQRQNYIVSQQIDTGSREFRKAFDLSAAGQREALATLRTFAEQLKVKPEEIRARREQIDRELGSANHIMEHMPKAQTVPRPPATPAKGPRK